jgi:hypothetical protein
MPKNYEVMEQIKENLTLSGADTYTEIELTLLEEIGKRNKKGDKIKVMMIWGIQLEFKAGACLPWDTAGGATNDKWELQITTNSESAMVGSQDKDVVFKTGQVSNFLTGGHNNIIEIAPIIWFPQPLPYIKKRLWIGADSTGLTGVLSVDITIYHTYGYVSQFTLNRMIAKKI